MKSLRITLALVVLFFLTSCAAASNETAAPVPTATQTLSPSPAVTSTKAPPAPGELVTHVGRGTLNDVAYSPDGRFVFAAFSAGVTVFRAADLSEVAFLPVLDSAQALGLFADGQELAIGTLLGNVLFARFDPLAGSISLLPQTLDARPEFTSNNAYSDQVVALAISPDGKLAGVASGYQVQFWNIQSGKAVLPQPFNAKGLHFSSIHFSDNSQYAWVASRPGVVDSVIDLGSARVVLKVNAPGQFLGEHDFVYNPTNSYTAQKFSLKIFSLPDQRTDKEFSLQGNPMKILFSADGKTLAAIYKVPAGAGMNVPETTPPHPAALVSYPLPRPRRVSLAPPTLEFVVTLFDTASGKGIHTSYGLGIPATDNLLGSPDNFIFSGDWLLATDWVKETPPSNEYYCVLHGINLLSRETSLPFPKEKSLVGRMDCRVVFSSDQQHVAFFNPSGLVLLNAGAQQAFTQIASHPAPVTALAYSSNGAFLAAGRGDTSVQVFEMADGLKLLHEQSLETNPGNSFHTPGGITGIVFYPAGDLFALGSSSGILHWLSTQPGSSVPIVTIPRGGAEALYGLAVAPDGATLATGGYQNAVLLRRDLRGGAGDKLLEDTSPVTVIQYAPGENLLAAGTGKGVIRLWNPATATLERSLKGHTAWVSGLAFDTTGDRLFSVSEDGTARLWQVAGAAPAQVLELDAPVTSMALDPQGLLWAMGTQAGNVYFWNIETAQWAGHLRIGAAPIYALVFSPDGAQLALGTQSGQMELWQVRDAGGRVAAFTPGGPQKRIAAPESCLLVSSQVDSAQQGTTFVAGTSARLTWDLIYRGDCAALDEKSLHKAVDLPEIVSKFTLAQIPANDSVAYQRLHITAEVTMPGVAGTYAYTWQLATPAKTAALTASFTVVNPSKTLNLPAPLYFISEGGSLLRLEKDGRTQSPILDAPLQCMDISGSGEIAYLSEDRLMLADSNGGNQRQFLPLAGCPAWSSDGAWIALRMNGVKLLNVTTGEIKTLARDLNAYGFNVRSYLDIVGWSPSGDKLIASAGGWESFGTYVFDVNTGDSFSLHGETFSWSRNGESVYSAQAEMNCYLGELPSIVRTNALTQEPESLLGNSESDLSGGLSPFEAPDGRLLAFAGKDVRPEPCSTDENSSLTLYPAQMSLRSPGKFTYDKSLSFLRSELRNVLWWKDGRAAILALAGGQSPSPTYWLVRPFVQPGSTVLPIRGANLRWGKP